MPSLLGPLVFQKPAGAEDRERYRAPCQKQWPNSLRREPKQKVHINKFCALQDFSQKGFTVRHTSRSLGWSANVREKSGASGGRKHQTGRGRNRFKGTRKIKWPGRLNRRRGGRQRCCCHRCRQHKGNRSEQRAVGIVAARHRASYHSRHVVSAIHVIGWRNGSLLMMVRGDWALPARAARGLIRRPRRAPEGRV